MIRNLFVSLCPVFCFFSFLQVQTRPAVNGERSIVLVTTSYNNSKWYKRNLDAIFEQNYSNWKIIYVDDLSPDGTRELVENYVQDSPFEDKVVIVKNERRKLKVENFYHAVHTYCDDDDIVIDYDGDDWLAHPDVLSIINQIYEDPEVWITYGSYVNWPKPLGCCCEQISQEFIDNNSYRYKRWMASHLKSFYAWLFKKIRPESLQFQGQFFDMAGDLAFMFPMLEMAGGRFKFVPDVLYIYNTGNPLNDCKKNRKRQFFLDSVIRGKPRYERLVCSPLQKRGI